MFICLPVSSLYTQKKKMIKVRAYLLLDMKKKKIEKNIYFWLLHVSQ
jgi:hypothetical protein